MAKKTLSQIKDVIKRALDMQDRSDLCEDGQAIYDELAEIVGVSREVEIEFSGIENVTIPPGKFLYKGDEFEATVDIFGKKYQFYLTVETINND